MNILDSFGPELIKFYNIANTPHFLYRKLKNSNFIQSISEQNDSEPLKHELNKITNKYTLEPEDAAIAYALLVALGSMKAIDNIEFISTKLAWAKDIWNFVKHDRESVNTTIMSNNNQAFSHSALYFYSNNNNPQISTHIIPPYSTEHGNSIK